MALGWLVKKFSAITRAPRGANNASLSPAWQSPTIASARASSGSRSSSVVRC
jgi:hypothetical protein